MTILYMAFVEPRGSVFLTFFNYFLVFYFFFWQTTRRLGSLLQHEQVVSAGHGQDQAFAFSIIVVFQAGTVHGSVFG